MDTVLDRGWTVESFLAWEDRQEGKHEFDGQRVIPMTGGSLAHQRIVFNLMLSLMRTLGTGAFQAAQEMRIRSGRRIRYPDVTVFSGPLDQATRTLADATVILEVLSDDTATTDRVEKLIDYAAIPSLCCYVLLEQTAIGATVFRRDGSGPWTATAMVDGILALPEIGVELPLADVYAGLTFSG